MKVEFINIVHNAFSKVNVFSGKMTLGDDSNLTQIYPKCGRVKSDHGAFA